MIHDLRLKIGHYVLTIVYSRVDKYISGIALGFPGLYICDHLVTTPGTRGWGRFGPILPLLSHIQLPGRPLLHHSSGRGCGL